MGPLSCLWGSWRRRITRKQASMRLPCALIVTLRAGRPGGATRPPNLHILSPAFGQGAVVTPCLLRHKKPLRWTFYGNLNPTPGRPGPVLGRPWALPIRSGLCLPCAPALRASYCHAAARSQPGRFRCGSGYKQPGCARLGLYPSLRSKLPCSRPARFLIKS